MGADHWELWSVDVHLLWLIRSAGSGQGVRKSSDLKQLIRQQDASKMVYKGSGAELSIRNCLCSFAWTEE